MGALQQIRVVLKRIVTEAHVGQIKANTLAIKHPHHNALAMHGGQRRDPEVQLVALDTHHNAAVLRKTAFSDVEVSQQFDARHNGSGKIRISNLTRLLKHAINPIP